MMLKRSDFRKKTADSSSSRALGCVSRWGGAKAGKPSRHLAFILIYKRYRGVSWNYLQI